MSIDGLFAGQRLVAVVRHRETHIAAELATAAVAGGIRVVEITTTVPDAAELVRDLTASLPDGVLVGGGTVLTGQDAELLVAAGASFLVSPVLAQPVLDVARQRDVPLLPGVATPTEAFTAFQLGCPTVKLFPAQALGPATLRALTEVLPGLGVVPTGGVSLVNAADWLGAGALAVGVGGALNTAYRTGGSAAVTELAEQLVERCPALATTGSGAAR